MTEFRLEKLLWDDTDFDVMGWHDATIWSMCADTERFEYLVDLDYIFNWVDPGPDETYYKFWVSPVTMVFENASNVRIDLESQQGSIEIADLHREMLGPSPNGKYIQYNFRFECQEGAVSLQGTGYRMHVRRPPSLLGFQSFSLSARGGISFSRNSDET